MTQKEENLSFIGGFICGFCSAVCYQHLLVSTSHRWPFYSGVTLTILSIYFSLKCNVHIMLLLMVFLQCRGFSNRNTADIGVQSHLLQYICFTWHAVTVYYSHLQAIFTFRSLYLHVLGLLEETGETKTHTGRINSFKSPSWAVNGFIPKTVVL